MQLASAKLQRAISSRDIALAACFRGWPPAPQGEFQVVAWPLPEGRSSSVSPTTFSHAFPDKPAQSRLIRDLSVSRGAPEINAGRVRSRLARGSNIKRPHRDRGRAWPGTRLREAGRKEQSRKANILHSPRPQIPSPNLSTVAEAGAYSPSTYAQEGTPTGGDCWRCISWQVKRSNPGTLPVPI